MTGFFPVNFFIVVLMIICLFFSSNVVVCFMVTVVIGALEVVAFDELVETYFGVFPGEIVL